MWSTKRGADMNKQLQQVLALVIVLYLAISYARVRRVSEARRRRGINFAY